MIKLNKPSQKAKNIGIILITSKKEQKESKHYINL